MTDSAVDSNEEKGIIFNKVTGSLVDGYGVRTTIFLKGCPLRCAWCCDPESHNVFPELKFDPSKCDSCGKCVSVCPTGAIQADPKSGDGGYSVDRTLCTNCGKCVEVCYTGALSMFGTSITADDLFNLIKKDEEFYRSSGGGVTIGGGESTVQAKFAQSILKKCKEANINVAFDTCGYTTGPGFKLLEEADLLLYDLKGVDPEEHNRNTGKSNELILKNLKKLNEMGKPIIVRVPIIPGYNASERSMKSIAEFLSKLKSVKRVDLLPYHEFGKIKYGQLGREYRCHAQSPTTEQVESIKKLFEQYGLNTQIGG